MMVLATLGVLLVCGYFGKWLWQHYQHQVVLPMNIGLIGLGLVNTISGLGFAVAALGIGSIAVAAGMISMNLGVWLNEAAYENSPHPNVLGGRVGVSFFVTGLVFLLEHA